MKRAAIRLATDGLTWERWDNFAEEWQALPTYWRKRDALEFTASVCAVHPREVQIEPRAA